MNHSWNHSWKWRKRTPNKIGFSQDLLSDTVKGNFRDLALMSTDVEKNTINMA